MLKKIILILTEKYKQDVKESGELMPFMEEMKKHGTEVEMHGKNETASVKEVNAKSRKMPETTVLLQKSVSEIEPQEPVCEADTLFFSDDADVLSQLQEQGCYTVAVYHEGISGLLSGTQHAVEGVKDIEWEYLYKVHQRFCGEPWSISETKRCTIREMGHQDVDALYELYSGPNVTRYMEGLFPKKEQEEQYIKDYVENVYKYYGFGTWLVHRKEDGRLIGRAGFNYRQGFEEAELGFMIGEDFWRQGYAYEVCSHLMKLADKVYELGRVQAFVKKENTASVCLLKKLGFIWCEEVEMDGESYQRYMAELAL